MLFANGDIVKSVSGKQCLDGFISWLESIHSKCVIVAHNGFNFDFKVLINSLKRHNLLSEFEELDVAVCDTLFVSRKIANNVPDHKLVTLYKEAMGNDAGFAQHDASADAQALMAVFDFIGQANMYQYVKSFNEFSILYDHKQKLKNNVSVMRDQLADHSTDGKCIVSDRILQKMCESGIHMKHLLLAYRRDKEEGIKLILSETVEGKVRVTNRKAILMKINNFISRISDSGLY